MDHLWYRVHAQHFLTMVNFTFTSALLEFRIGTTDYLTLDSDSMIHNTTDLQHKYKYLQHKYK